jgi:hypothetical protein
MDPFSIQRYVYCVSTYAPGSQTVVSRSYYRFMLDTHQFLDCPDTKVFYMTVSHDSSEYQEAETNSMELQRQRERRLKRISDDSSIEEEIDDGYRYVFVQLKEPNELPHEPWAYMMSNTDVKELWSHEQEENLPQSTVVYMRVEKSSFMWKNAVFTQARKNGRHWPRASDYDKNPEQYDFV